MLIYNTTYHVHKSSEDIFIDWLKNEYVKQAMSDGKLHSPRLSLIMAKQEGDEGESYSLQFNVADLETLEAWYGTIGKTLVGAIGEKFGHNVAGFSTIMQVVDL